MKLLMRLLREPLFHFIAIGGLIFAVYAAVDDTGDCPGQCLVSDGFETRIGRVDKAKPIQTKKFAIHTLGQEYALSASPIQVWNVPLSRPSLPWLCCT